MHVSLTETPLENHWNCILYVWITHKHTHTRTHTHGDTHTQTRMSVLWAMCLWISVGIWLLFPFSVSQAWRLSAWVTALRPPRQPDWSLKTPRIISENVTTVLLKSSNVDPDRAFKIDLAIVSTPLQLVLPQPRPTRDWFYEVKPLG